MIRAYVRRQKWNTFWFGIVFKGWRTFEIRIINHEAHWR